MAREQQTAEPTVNVTQLAQAFSKAMHDSTRELREGDPEYRARQQAEGWFDAFDGGVTVLQNAYEANPRGETERTRYRAAHLLPGKYLKGRVAVSIESNGMVVRLSYPVKGDAMLINQSHWSSFGDLIDKIWAEMPPTPEPQYAAA